MSDEPGPDTKTCPSCAETIKAAAVKCRYCGTDLTPSVPPVEIPVIPGVQVTHVGDRFFLGVIVQPQKGGFQKWAIWDKLNPGKPVARFPFNPPGAHRARVTFAAWEPTGQAVVPMPKCPTCGSDNVDRISAGDKVATWALVGIFALGRAGKSYECRNCGASW